MSHTLHFRLGSTLIPIYSGFGKIFYKKLQDYVCRSSFSAGAPSNSKLSFGFGVEFSDVVSVAG